MQMTCTESLNVLVADDQSDVLQAIRLLLKGAGHRAETVDSPSALLRAAEARPYDVIVMDMNYARDTTSGHEGLEVIRTLRTQQNDTPIIVMTAWGTVDLAVEALRRGASDFVQKPWDNERLLASIAEQANRGRAASRVREEIEIARKVQRRLLPQNTRQLKTLQYAGRCMPAYDIGGDYYDFIDLGSDCLSIVLADVSGKGVGAALLMANLQALFRTQTDIATINRMFVESTPVEQFATLFFACYNDRTRELRYVNCGHPPALLLRAGGELERLEPTAPIIGIFSDWPHEERRIVLAPGDRLLICSDGVLEAEGIEEAALAAMLGEGSASDVVDRVVASVTGVQEDDVTAVALCGAGNHA